MFIYVLKDPDTNDVRYVGKTNNPKKRLSAHTSVQTGRNLPSIRWIRKLKEANKKPIMEIIEETDDWENSEKKWISFYRMRTNDLLNIDDGGIVIIRNHQRKEATSSKKYMSVMMKLSNLPKMSEEVSKFWDFIRSGIKSLRISILNEMGPEAVEYFDDCIYDEFVNRTPRKFRVVQ